MKTRLYLLLAVAVTVSLSALLPADTVVEEIIARVNNEIITRTEFAHSRDQLKQEAQQQNPSGADRVVAEKQRDVLRDLIDQQLLLQKGKDLGITGDTELIKRLDEMRKQMNLQSMEELEKAAEGQGISYEEFKQNTRNQIITQRVIGQEVGSHMTLNKDEVKKFYDEHQPEMQQPEQIRLSEILVAPKTPAAPAPAAGAPSPVPPLASAPAAGATPPAPSQAETDAALASAQAKAQDLLDQIHKGASFEDLAKKQSDGPSAAQGGDLSYFKRGVLAKVLEDRVFSLKAGETTDVIPTKQGFVILKVTEHQMAGVPTLKEVEPRIQDALYMQKLQPALRAYLTKLREEAFIDIKPGYIDTGASAKQTKPIETTSKDVTAKNLKKKKKLGVF
jgi:peptidyl-prolyl cis-trans isomerase SurA